MAGLPFDISRRELDVITLLALGYSNEGIAAALTLSVRTVTTHISNIMRKVGVSTRLGLASLANDRGVLGLPLPRGVESSEFRIGRRSRSAVPHVRGTPAPRRQRSAAKALVIGALVPTRGRGAVDAEQLRNGSVLAVEEINHRGGIHGRPVRLLPIDVDIDDRHSVETGVRQLLALDANAILSGYLAHQVAAIEIAAREGVPFLHSSALLLAERSVASDPLCRGHRRSEREKCF